MLCKHNTLIFGITCAYSIISKIWIKCSQFCKQFSWLISLYKAAEGAHTLFLVCHTQKNDKLHVHTRVHARACGWHGPVHICAHVVGSDCRGWSAQLQWLCLHLSCRPIGADVFSKRAGNEPRMAMVHILQGTLSGLVQPGPIRLRHPCVPWACSMSSQSAFSRWILPKRKPAGAFRPWSWMQTKAQLLGVIWRPCQQHGLDPEKVTSTRGVLETSTYLPELIFRCIRNQMDNINSGNCILLEWHVRSLHTFLNFLFSLCKFCRKCFTMEVHWEKKCWSHLRTGQTS